jgi:hypothetical protein
MTRSYSAWLFSGSQMAREALGEARCALHEMACARQDDTLAAPAWPWRRASEAVDRSST